MSEYEHNWLLAKGDMLFRDEYGKRFIIDWYICECGAFGKVVTPKEEYDKGNKKLGIEELPNE